MRVVSILLSLLACIAGPLASAQINVLDSENRTISLEQPAARIISLAPHITELFFELGAQNSLIATSEFSDYPPEAVSIERIGGYNTINLERIVALDPDLIIFWGAGNSRSGLSRLLDLGYTVYIDDPRSLSDIPYAMRNFGILAGLPEAGELQADAFTRQLDSIRAGQESGEGNVSVFYQVWNDPLQTLNRTHLVSGIMEFCGGRNIFAEESVIAPVVSLESIIQRNPDVIILGADDDLQATWLGEWRNYPGLKAVDNNQIFAIPPDSLQRPTSRILAGVGRLCTAIDEVFR